MKHKPAKTKLDPRKFRNPKPRDKGVSRPDQRVVRHADKLDKSISNPVFKDDMGAGHERYDNWGEHEEVVRAILGVED